MYTLGLPDSAGANVGVFLLGAALLGTTLLGTTYRLIQLSVHDPVLGAPGVASTADVAEGSTTTVTRNRYSGRDTPGGN